MKKLITSAAIVALGSSAYAGGIERSSQSIGIIFEKGNYAEFSFGYVAPNVSGTILGGALSSGNMAASYSMPAGGLKFSVSDAIDVAIIYDQPYGASVDYPVSAAPYPLAGTTAVLNSSALTGIVRYKMGAFSVHGGVRVQSVDAMVAIPALSYSLDGSTNSGTGFLVGAAFEKPEIALRVALTYNSKISHTMSALEVSAVATDIGIETPQSVNLDFQSGVAADTLVFGSVRWVNWSAFEYTPPVYFGGTGTSLLSYDNDVFTYSLGVGRKINDALSVALSVGYEKANGGIATNLAPTDGKASVTLGATYTRDNMKLTGGVSFIRIGNATTDVPTSPTTTTPSDFSGNTAVAVGFKLGFSI